MPARTGGHPAKMLFQAIRIAVKAALSALVPSLEQALCQLNVGGRISVILFQSLVHRLEQTMFMLLSTVLHVPRGLPVVPVPAQPHTQLVNRKPIYSSAAELAANHRAHSAKLRELEKIRN